MHPENHAQQLLRNQTEPKQAYLVTGVTAPLIAVELYTTERQSSKKIRKGAIKFYAEPQNFKESRNIGILLECTNNAKLHKITILCNFIFFYLNLLTFKQKCAILITY